MQDLTKYIGQQFNRWTVIGISDKPGYVKCQCNCEKQTIKDVNYQNLKSNNSKSCGCLKHEKLIEIKRCSYKQNEFDMSGEYGIGYDSKENKFYFSLDDYDKIISLNRCWWIKENYVCCKYLQKTIRLHNFIMNFIPVDNKGFRVDHINGISWDNRRENLRIVTITENAYNRGVNKNNKLGVRGVHQEKGCKTFTVKITHKGKTKQVNGIKTLDEAIAIRKKLELELHGEYTNDRGIRKDKE